MGKPQSVVAIACCLLSPILLSGCAQYQWQKYGATQSDFNRDSYEYQAAQAGEFKR